MENSTYMPPAPKQLSAPINITSKTSELTSALNKLALTMDECTNDTSYSVSVYQIVSLIEREPLNRGAIARAWRKFKLPPMVDTAWPAYGYAKEAMEAFIKGQISPLLYR